MTSNNTVHAWVLAQRPVGAPTTADFRWVETPLRALADGEVLVRTRYLSVDPYMRPRMRPIRSYIPSFELHQPLEADVVGSVEDSRHPQFSIGERVTGRLFWADKALVSGDKLRKIPTTARHLPWYLSALGMTGLSAYFALLEIGQPKPGETVVISGAAGAVGSIAGQIAKIRGCRVIGIAGSDEKCDFLKTTCGFDAALNYKTTTPFRKSLKTQCPDGIDVYFDNVGGPLSDDAITLINLKARIIICGQISLYNLESPPMGPRLNSYLLVKRARMEGFLVHDYMDRAEVAQKQLSAWLESGQLKSRETIVEGLENAPNAFMGLFRGDNIGKQLIKVS